MNPKVTVIIPTYNRKHQLPRSVGSVLQQTLQDFEVVIVDDASTDGTEEFVRENFSDPRIRYEKLAQNSGVHAARNRGLRVAKGEFAVALDSDDELLPHALERAVAVMKDPTIGAACAPYKFLNGDMTGYERPDGEMSFDELVREDGVRKKKGGFALLRMSVVGDGGWAERNLDFIFFRRLAAKTRMYYIAEPLGIYHLDSTNHQHVIRKKPNPQLSIHRARALASFLDDLGERVIAASPMMYGFYAYGAAVGLLLDGETKRARHFARGALIHQPRLKYASFYFFSLLPGASALLRSLFAFKAWRLKTR